MKKIYVVMCLVLLSLSCFLFFKTRFAVIFTDVSSCNNYSNVINVLGEPMHCLKLDDENDMTRLKNISRISDWDKNEKTKVSLFPINTIPHKYIFVIYNAETEKILRVGWFHM